jgi:hypothetical protein
MKNVVLFVLASVAVLFAGERPQNWQKTEFNMANFKADTVRRSTPFNVTDYENIVVAVKVNDTDAAGFAGDSVAMGLLWQRGYFIDNGSGAADTTWLRPSKFIDTVRISTATFPAATASIFPDSSMHNTFDTNNVTGVAVATYDIFPIWSPIARIVAYGLTGNNKSSFLSFGVEVSQRRYTKVNGLIGN